MSLSKVNRTITSRAFEEIWNQGNLDAIDVLYAEEFVEHGNQLEIASGRTAFKHWVSAAVASFNYERLTVEELYSAGDKVAVRYTVLGCALGSPGNRRGGSAIEASRGTVVLRICDGRIRESWGIAKMLELLYRCR
jgi:hypothetical protein